MAVRKDFWRAGLFVMALAGGVLLLTGVFWGWRELLGPGPLSAAGCALLLGLELISAGVATLGIFRLGDYLKQSREGGRHANG